MRKHKFPVKLQEAQCETIVSSEIAGSSMRNHRFPVKLQEAQCETIDFQ